MKFGSTKKNYTWRTPINHYNTLQILTVAQAIGLCQFATKAEYPEWTITLCGVTRAFCESSKEMTDQLLRERQDAGIWNAIEANNFKQALKLVDKRLAKKNTDYLEVCNLK